MNTKSNNYCKSFIVICSSSNSVTANHEVVLQCDDRCHCHPIISCFIKIQNGLTFLVSAYPGCPGKQAVKWISVMINFTPLLFWWRCNNHWLAHRNIVRKDFRCLVGKEQHAGVTNHTKIIQLCVSWFNGRPCFTLLQYKQNNRPAFQHPCKYKGTTNWCSDRILFC